MIEIDFERLRSIGMTPAILQHIQPELDREPADGGPPDAEPVQLMRLTEVHRETVRLHDGRHEHSARVLPRLLRTLA